MKIKVGKLISCLLLFSIFSGMTANAQTPYKNYTYSFNGEPQEEPQAYIPTGVITGNSLGTENFKEPQDVFAADDGKVYIADTGNNRILILSADWKINKIIKNFGDNNEDSFNNPSGVFVTSKNDLYVADTNNERIVVFDKNGELKKIFNAPDSKMMVTAFQPLKLTVDIYGRIYVVSRGSEKGFIQLEKDGSFLSYYGAIKTSLSAGEAIWRIFMTEEQKQLTSTNIPTVYSNCDVDSDGFVYGTVSASGEIYNANIMIRKLNPLGADILKREGFFGVSGDIAQAHIDNKPFNSKFVDICVQENGVYSVLDSEKKRVFTYDYMGNLMCVFGAEGSQSGSFKEPVGIDATPDGTFLVLDSKYNHINIFKPTEYVLLLNEASVLQYQRKYDEAAAKWNDVLKYTSKSELAYNNLGKIMLAQEKYEDALFYFKLGNYRDYYSEAFKYYRKALLNDYFYLIFAGLAVVIAIIIILRLVLKRKKRKAAVK